MDMKELFEKMQERAENDSEFKERLLKNSKETIEKELGAKFDDDVKVTVVESTPEHVHFVLPRA